MMAIFGRETTQLAAHYSKKASQKKLAPTQCTYSLHQSECPTPRTTLKVGQLRSSENNNLAGKWQERRDSNPQPPVLETGALPIELHS